VFKLSRKTVINFILSTGALLLISNSVSCFKNSAHNSAKPGLSLIGLAQRELAGLFFYHRNMVKAEQAEEQIELLRSKLFDMREIYQENSRLKALLGFKQKSPHKLVAAKVIGRFPDSWASGVIIDKGRLNGISQNMAVINHIGLIGKVVETTPTTSKVLLINDPNQGISSIVQSSRQEGLISGSLGVNLVMRYLPDDALISVGDIIVTSELSQIYPKGLLIGKVIKIGYEFSGLNRFAVVKPAVDLANLEEVFVILQ